MVASLLETRAKLTHNTVAHGFRSLVSAEQAAVAAEIYQRMADKAEKGANAAVFSPQVLASVGLAVSM
jgi:hypothetical protein